MLMVEKILFYLEDKNLTDGIVDFRFLCQRFSAIINRINTHALQITIYKILLFYFKQAHTKWEKSCWWACNSLQCNSLFNVIQCLY